MAKAKLTPILENIKGRLTGDSEFYTTTRYGRTVISNYPLHRAPGTITEHQHELSQSFGERSKQCALEMKDPARKAYWEGLYKDYIKIAKRSHSRANAQFFNIDPKVIPPTKQTVYKSLRGFVMAQLAKNNP